MNWGPPLDAPHGVVVTTTSTAPTSCSGATIVIEVASLTTNDVTATPPNVTPATSTKPVPVIVTEVPAAPVDGLRLDTAGPPVGVGVGVAMAGSTAVLGAVISSSDNSRLTPRRPRRPRRAPGVNTRTPVQVRRRLGAALSLTK